MFTSETERKKKEKYLFKYVAILVNMPFFPIFSWSRDNIIPGWQMKFWKPLILVMKSYLFCSICQRRSIHYIDRTLLIERLRLYLNFLRHFSAMVHIIILIGPFSESNYWWKHIFVQMLWVWCPTRIQLWTFTIYFAHFTSWRWVTRLKPLLHFLRWR